PWPRANPGGIGAGLGYWRRPRRRAARRPLSPAGRPCGEAPVGRSGARDATGRAEGGGVRPRGGVPEGARVVAGALGGLLVGAVAAGRVARRPAPERGPERRARADT